MYVGLGFLGLLAVGKMIVCLLGYFGGLWAFLGILLLGKLRCGMDCLLGSLRCMASGPSEHFALQRAWGLWDVWLVGLLPVEGNWGAEWNF